MSVLVLAVLLLRSLSPVRVEYTSNKGSIPPSSPSRWFQSSLELYADTPLCVLTWRDAACISICSSIPRVADTVERLLPKDLGLCAVSV